MGPIAGAGRWSRSPPQIRRATERLASCEVWNLVDAQVPVQLPVPVPIPPRTPSSFVARRHCICAASRLADHAVIATRHSPSHSVVNSSGGTLRPGVLGSSPSRVTFPSPARTPSPKNSRKNHRIGGRVGLEALLLIACLVTRSRGAAVFLNRCTRALLPVSGCWRRSGDSR